jgi:hypothetical protein
MACVYMYIRQNQKSIFNTIGYTGYAEYTGYRSGLLIGSINRNKHIYLYCTNVLLELKIKIQENAS